MIQQHLIENGASKLAERIVALSELHKQVTYPDPVSYGKTVSECRYCVAQWAAATERAMPLQDPEAITDPRGVWPCDTMEIFEDLEQ